VAGSRPADVTIRARRAAACTYLEFRARRPGVPPFSATLGNDKIAAVREQLDKGLTDLKYALPRLPVPLADLDHIDATLSRLGRRIQFALFGSRPEIIRGLRDFWGEALPFARNPDRPPLVEFAGDIATQLPVEFFRLPAPDRGGAITSTDDFIRSCRSFVGFSCIVRRAVLPIPIRGDITLDTLPDQRVPLRYLYFEGLDGARDELSWFTTASAHRVRLEGPYPDGGECPPSLAEQVFDPSLLLAGGRRGLPDQVQHFSCHCYTADDPFDSEIELSGNGAKIRLTLGTLGEDLVELAERSSLPAGDLPLVFMNACGSARLRATTSFSFPAFFLEHGNRGFVGTEVDMPDPVAAAFSRAFYERFLLYGEPLGRAMLEARNHLLHQYGNPLGLAYTAYADPQVHIRPVTASLSKGSESSVTPAS
jgi:hypothetical protein